MIEYPKLHSRSHKNSFSRVIRRIGWILAIGLTVLLVTYLLGFLGEAVPKAP